MGFDNEQLEPPELSNCPFCPTERRETHKVESGAYIGVIIHDLGCYLAQHHDDRRQVLTPLGITAWNTCARVRDGGVATVGQRHWQLRIGAQETMCGRDIKGVSFTLLSEYVTCGTCNAAKFGYQMGRADERAAATASTAGPVPEWSVEHPDREREYWSKLGKDTAVATKAADEIGKYLDAFTPLSPGADLLKTIAGIIQRAYEPETPSKED